MFARGVMEMDGSRELSNRNFEHWRYQSGLSEDEELSPALENALEVGSYQGNTYTYTSPSFEPTRNT